MTNKIEPVFLIKQKSSSLFLYCIENENTGELENKFENIEIEGRLSSVLGLSDDEFDSEYDYKLQAFSTIESVEKFIENEVSSDIYDDIEIVKMKVSVNFEVV